MYFLIRKNLRILYKEKILKKKVKNMINFMNFKININNSLLYLFKITIFGMNLKYYIKKINIKYGLSCFLKLFFLNNKKLLNFQEKFKNLFINNDRLKYINNRLNLKKNLKLYSIQRQLLNLPSRGQRSKTNARTSKNKTTIYIKKN